MNSSQSKNTYIAIGILIFVIAIGIAVWFLFRGSGTPATPTGDGTSSGFSPFGRTGTGGRAGKPNATSTTQNVLQNGTAETPIPVLRLLSDTPVGGYGASTTASTTIVRWADRGRGNILEAREDSWNINTLSNTLVPRIYESAWNKNLTAFVASILPEGSSVANTVYAELKANPVSTSSTSFNPINLSPYNLQGQSLPSNIVSYALSPKKDKIFLFSIQDGRGVGYISSITGGKLTQLFDTPVTQVNVSWPEDNTIALVTKGTSSQEGFLYFVDPKTGVWKKIIGNIGGLSAIVSHDAKYVFVSGTGPNNNVVSYVYSIAKNKYNDALISTLADKCTWGNFYKNVVYCAVPFQPVAGTYPDDWYQGTLSTVDKIWQVNADTGEVHQVSSATIDQSDRFIDAYKLGTDSKDNFLIFMNKNDLSLWSLDLVRSK